MALVPRSAIQIARAGIECVFRRVVSDRVHMTAEHRVVGVAQPPARRSAPRRAVVPKMRILTECVGDLHRAPAVGRIVDVDGCRPAQDVAVIPPHQHLPAAHSPRDNARNGMKVPPGIGRVLRCMRDVVRAVLCLHRNLTATPEIVSAKVKLRARRKENVPIPKDVAEGDTLGVGKCQAAWPGAAVVFG